MFALFDGAGERGAADAQRYCLGVNHNLIPVNAARCPVHNYHREGTMRVDGNFGSTLAYEPNSYGEWHEHPEFKEPPLSLEGAADHWNAGRVIRTTILSPVCSSAL